MDQKQVQFSLHYQISIYHWCMWTYFLSCWWTSVQHVIRAGWPDWAVEWLDQVDDQLSFVCHCLTCVVLFGAHSFTVVIVLNCHIATVGCWHLKVHPMYTWKYISFYVVFVYRNKRQCFIRYLMDVFFIKGSLTDIIHKEMEKSNQLFQMCLYFYYISQKLQYCTN